jgi:hypothetical protein
MVVAELRIESVRKVKKNPYYGDYEVKHVDVRTIENQKYSFLESPENGIVLKFKNIDGEKLTITIDKHYFTGLKPSEITNDCTFDTSFGHNGCIYQVCVNAHGELEYLYEWFSRGDFEDGNEADNVYTGKSKGVKWELLEK